RTPKVSDFGLAKFLPAAGPSASLTATGAVVGTPSYMSPEQARAGEVGPPADVWALGAILYECLTGRPAFRAANVFETLQQVANGARVRPGRRDRRVPRDLETVALRCLEKDPGRRYAGAAALADDLQRWLDGRPIRARRTPAWERAAKWSRRNPAVAAL